MSAPKSPHISIVILTLIPVIALAWSSVTAPCIEIGFFWASVVTALSTALYAWTNSNRMGQGSMLLVYCLLACSITLAVASIVDIANYSFLGKFCDAQTGILLGSLIAFSTVTCISFRCSKQFPASLSWLALLAFLIVLGFSSLYFRDLAPEYTFIGTVAAILVGMTAFILICCCKQNLSDNQYISVLSIIAVFISFNSPSTKENFAVGLTSSSLLFLAGLLFFVERRVDSTATRIAGLILLYIGFTSVVQDTLYRGIGINEIVAGIPTLFCSVLIIAWIHFRKAAIPRGLYWVSLLIFGLFGIASIIPESHSAALTMPILSTLILFIVACVLYASTASPPIRRTWQEQFRYAMVAGGFIIVLTVTAAWFTLSTDMLVRNYELTRIVALLKGTSLWMGDGVFIRMVMRIEGLWPEDVGKTNIEGQSAKQIIKAIRPSTDRFSSITKAEDDRLEDLGYETEGTGIRWIILKDCLALLKVNSRSSAGSANLSRGDKIVAVNGKQVKDFKDRKELGRSLSNWNDGKTVTLGILTKSGLHRTVPIPFSVNLQDQPFNRIVNSQKRDKVGYLYLDSFDAAQFKKIKEHFVTFRKAGVQDLVLDLRYNGGGLAGNSALLANLIAGKTFFGKHFISTEHSQRHIDQNTEYLFENLPESLHIKRLVVLTTNVTCSASEVVINGLRPYMPVYTVGSTTCGKPYMMQGFRFGEEIIYPITARVVNSLGEGHYIAGIRPDFKAEDDLNHQLGDPQEGMLKKALEVLREDATSI